MIYTLLYTFTCGVLFSYISSASFVIQGIFGFSELGFAIIFGLNAVGIAIGSALSLRFRRIQNAALTGAVGITLFSLLDATAYMVMPEFMPYEIFTFLLLVSVGVILPSSTTMAMDEGREMAGTASAIFGASGFLFGSIVTPLVGLGNIMTTTFILLIGCSLLALFFILLAKKRF